MLITYTPSISSYSSILEPTHYQHTNSMNSSIHQLHQHYSHTLAMQISYHSVKYSSFCTLLARLSQLILTWKLGWDRPTSQLRQSRIDIWHLGVEYTKLTSTNTDFWLQKKFVASITPHMYIAHFSSFSDSYIACCCVENSKVTLLLLSLLCQLQLLLLFHQLLCLLLYLLLCRLLC